MKCSNCKVEDATRRLSCDDQAWFFCETCFQDLVEKADDLGLADRLHWDKSDEEYIVCPDCEGGLFYLPLTGGCECDNCGKVILNARMASPN